MKKLLLSTSCVLALILASNVAKAEEKNNDIFVVEKISFDDLVNLSVDENGDVVVKGKENVSEEVPANDVSSGVVEESVNIEPRVFRNLAEKRQDALDDIEIIGVNFSAMPKYDPSKQTKEEAIKNLEEFKRSEENRIIYEYDKQRKVFLERLYEIKDMENQDDATRDELKKIQDKINRLNTIEDNMFGDIEKYIQTNIDNLKNSN